MTPVALDRTTHATEGRRGAAGALTGDSSRSREGLLGRRDVPPPVRLGTVRRAFYMCEMVGYYQGTRGNTNRQGEGARGEISRDPCYGKTLE